MLKATMKERCKLYVGLIYVFMKLPSCRWNCRWPEIMCSSWILPLGVHSSRPRTRNFVAAQLHLEKAHFAQNNALQLHPFTSLYGKSTSQ